MVHPTIDAEILAERYVTGRLAPEEAAGFEEHYLDCPDCCARVEAAERLQRGMRRLAEEAAAGAPAAPRGSRWSRSPRLALAAAAVLVALLPAVLQLREVERLRSELDSTRAALARAEAESVDTVRPDDRLSALERQLEAARRDLAAETVQRQALAREIEAARRPQVDLPVLILTPVRGGLDDPVRTLTLPREPGWIALWAEPGDAGFPAYRATLRNASEGVVVQRTGLALNDLGALLLTLHSASLTPGSYRLEIDGLHEGGAAVPVGRFPLRIVGRG